VPKSLKSRFNGNLQEVIEYTRVWGRVKAMEKYEVKDYVAFSRFIEDETHDENLGIHPLLTGDTNKDLAENLLDAIFNKLLQAREIEKQKEEEIKHLKTEVEYLRGQQAIHLEPKIQAILSECKT